MSKQDEFWPRPERSTSVVPPPKTLHYPPPRPAGPQRTGTILNHVVARKVFGQRPKRKGLGLMGYVDPSARVFQSGGELHSHTHCPAANGESHGGFLYYAKDWITWADDIHTQIQSFPDVDWIEMIDNCQSRCFRIARDVLLREAVWYHQKLGKRWGVAITLWEELPYAGPRVRFDTDD